MNTLILTGGTAVQRKKAIEQTLLEWNITAINTIEILKHEEKQSIGVEDVRDTISHLSLLPLSGEHQCLLISEMDLLTPEAMNALLKTIEEPPTRTYILISSANAETILPTIRSRCLTNILISPTETLSKESEADFFQHITILSTGTTREKLTLLRKYLKREDALLWIDSFLPYVETNILTRSNPSDSPVDVRKAAVLAQKLLETRDLLNRNIHPILIMDELALGQTFLI